MTKLCMHIAVSLIVGMLCMPAVPHADQAQHFYDELRRLVGVVDGQGNTAAYNYDEAGNLLSIQRFTTGGTGIGIFVLTPSSTLVGPSGALEGATGQDVAAVSTEATGTGREVTGPSPHPSPHRGEEKISGEWGNR